MQRSYWFSLILLASSLAGCIGASETRTEWAFEATQLAAASAAGRTGTGVTVALLDTGINVAHNALKHLADGEPGNGELVGFQDYLHGRSGVENAYDDDGHGSHVAGIIAAEGSSLSDKITYGGIELLGGAPHVRLLVAKVCGPDGCRADSLADAVRWAMDSRAQIISLSLGSQGGVSFLDRQTDPEARELTDAINAAVSQGIVVIAAAGNAGPSNADVSMPADIPDVIAVGAIQRDGAVWTNSSRGSSDANRCPPTSSSPLPLPLPIGRCDPNKKPELVAPGVEVLSAWTGDGYARATGTSQATPFVTATVALMLEGRPPLNDRDDVVYVKRILQSTAAPVPGHVRPHDNAAGYGLVQAMAALQAYQP